MRTLGLLGTAVAQFSTVHNPIVTKMPRKVEQGPI